MPKKDNPVLGQAWGSFLGIQCSQISIDFFMWDRFLSAYPLKHCIELGTGSAGFSAFLALNCKWRGIKFSTFDTWNCVPTVNQIRAILGLEIDLHLVDVFTEGKAFVRKLTAAEAPGPILLYCDDGDKPREIREIGALLRPGDYLAVHDWYFEIDETDIALPLVPLMQPECEAVGSMTRWFRKAATA